MVSCSHHFKILFLADGPNTIGSILHPIAFTRHILPSKVHTCTFQKVDGHHHDMNR